jgi:hypothetical protein
MQRRRGFAAARPAQERGMLSEFVRLNLDCGRGQAERVTQNE